MRAGAFSLAPNREGRRIPATGGAVASWICQAVALFSTSSLNRAQLDLWSLGDLEKFAGWLPLEINYQGCGTC